MKRKPRNEAEALADDVARAHLRLDYLTNGLEDVEQRLNNLSGQAKLSLDSHHDEIAMLREVVAALWKKLMPGTQGFLDEVDAIMSRKKPRT